MKKLLTTLLLSLLFICYAYAGGDDRDLVLPKNSLNVELDKTPSFLQDDTLELIQLDTDEGNAQAQPKLISQDTNEISQEISKVNNSVSSSILVDDGKGIMDFTVMTRYFMTEKGIILMLIFLVIGLIFLFNFFIREK
jgi:hypothetical protein